MSKTKNKTSFFSLPRELRQKIYFYAMTELAERDQRHNIHAVIDRNLDPLRALQICSPVAPTRTASHSLPFGPHLRAFQDGIIRIAVGIMEAESVREEMEWVARKVGEDVLYAHQDPQLWKFEVDWKVSYDQHENRNYNSYD